MHVFVNSVAKQQDAFYSNYNHLNKDWFELFYCILILCCIVFSDYLFKLLLIGDSGVGKSCLLLRFAVSELSRGVPTFQLKVNNESVRNALLADIMQ